MRRGHLIVLVALAALSGATVATAYTGGRRTASVWLSKCSRSHHSAVFHGRMRRVHGTERMRMRFTVLERVGDDDFEPVRAPALWRWRKSRPGVRVFGFRQRLRGLMAGADYRARVDFRWLDGDGDVIRRARRRSGLCRQYGPLPNLRVESLRAGQTATPGTSRYVVRVSNSGRRTARQVPVALSVDGASLDRRLVASVAPGEDVPVAFVGPSCEGDDSPVEATVDPDDAIRESREGDNRREAACGDIAR
jgi:hypothetical protein